MTAQKTLTSDLCFPRWILALATGLLVLIVWLIPTARAAAAGPQWSPTITAIPSGFISGAEGNPENGPRFKLVAQNVGDGPTSGTYTMTVVLPAEFIPAAGISGKDAQGNPLSCESTGQTATCTGANAVGPFEQIEMNLPVNVAGGSSGKSPLTEASVEGGGAATVSTSTRTPIGVPAWTLTVASFGTNFQPGATAAGENVGRIPQYNIIATNVGGALTSGPITITDTLPPALTPVEAEWRGPDHQEFTFPCSITEVRKVTCEIPNTVAVEKWIQVIIAVNVDAAAPPSLINEATIEGGGALPATTSTMTTVSASQATWNFIPGLNGFSTYFTEADGSASAQAGSHPYRFANEFAFTSKGNQAEEQVGVLGRPRDLRVDFPQGFIVNPMASPKRCTEVQLQNIECPDESQVGLIEPLSALVGPHIFGSPLYNLVPPPGVPAAFGFEAGGTGVFIHIMGAVRSDGDYGLSGVSDNTYFLRMLFRVQTSLWGDPSNPIHDTRRARCGFQTETCSRSVPPHDTAFLSMPSHCGAPIVSHVSSDSWEEPGVFHETSAESLALDGTPASVDGCNQLEFEPTIEAKPTTNLADSPSGLDFNLHQPQNLDVDGVSTAMMRDATVTLPKGLTVNPSSANGQGACTEAQAHVNSLTAAECPDSSKLGSVEVTTPLLKQPLQGALYLAKPYENPFGSLIALYLAVDDPKSGTVSNLAGRVTTDPVTGQLSTRFEENPELPLEDIDLHLFTGPRASLRTPPTCGTYEAKADITPWSTPETPDVHPTDSFAIQAVPGGGNCPTSEADAPNSPSFTAGTAAPQAGAYSPFLLKVTRNDATQPIAGIETTMAPGLIGKLAGIPYCSEGQIAQAQSRSKPREGAIEQADPSCPAASEVGTVDVAAGAGITPLHVQGRAYLAGPYKGAPISLVIITPAVAGPFDLGAVTSRVALYVNSETAQVRAVSDPLPTILEGIPLDVRQISLRAGRPEFILNPTSCDPMSITGTLTSTLGQSAALSSPFQVGGCNALPFKPNLAIRLKGQTKRTGHPALTAVVNFKAGQANVKRAQVTLPRSEFLDQAHIGTVCTRVQFAADQCPAASVYGKARAITPLLDQPLQGLVYLRSSSHELPDLVIALEGQVDVVLAGRIDSVNGGIRSTFEAVPDAPVSKFVLEMQGGRKGLLINSANLCKLKAAATRATVLLDGQNGKASDTNPVVRSSCKAKQRKGKGKKPHSR